jgi:transposase InsO family protein
MKRYLREYPVDLMSRVLGVSSSGYYKWLKTKEKRELHNDIIDLRIKDAFKKSYNTYGSPRITDFINRLGTECSKSTVGRRMRKLKLIARRRRKFVVTTDSKHEFKVAENLLDRNFEVDAVNTVWVSDITYIRVKSSWMYLTTFIDLADRMVVGWSLSANMTTEDTVCKAFRKAVLHRGVKKNSNLMIHSDRGIQYASKEFRALISQFDCIQSMSRKGNCWDNAVAESFFKTIKVEALNRYNFTSVNMLDTIIFRYIEGFYNTIRIHSSLGGLSPLQTSKCKNLKLAA